MIWGNRDEQQVTVEGAAREREAPPTLLALFGEEIVTPRRRYSGDAGLRLSCRAHAEAEAGG